MFKVRIVFKSGHVEEVKMQEWITQKGMDGRLVGARWTNVNAEGKPQLHHVNLDEVVFISTELVSG